MKTLALIIVLSFFAGVAFAQDTLPDLPMGVEAQSLFGENLTSPKSSMALLANYESAKVTFDADPYDVDNIIWYGRRVAYLGRYREAIEIYSKGLKEHPNDARLYRHRGHRYISIREFDRAIEDFEKAAALIEGMENEVEPDGVPNLLGIPISSLHGNIFYHLGLSYYLKQDWENALRAYRNGFNSSRNDDNRVSTTYWIYLILLRMERPDEAQEALDVISKNMTIIENMSYHQLCLLYKGEIEIEDMMDANANNPTNAAVAYGIANWYYYNGNDEKANEVLNNILEGASWASFGFIAAEADMVNK
jgi:tetratricopeptide (TPR) repeat protein